jgi:methionyl aminopeptidase
VAIEPMIAAGGPEVEILEDGWTAVTRDRRPAAHYEHTVAMTETGPEILSARTPAAVRPGTGLPKEGPHA